MGAVKYVGRKPGEALRQYADSVFDRLRPELQECMFPSHPWVQMSALPQNAAASVDGTIYQFCLALERCFALLKGESVWIERFGDVTTPASQLESKAHSEALTDNHENLWKTLLNWLQPGFNHQPYSSLVLVTTQRIGAGSQLAPWNSLDADQRLGILKAIRVRSESRLLKRQAKDSKATAPKALDLQRAVLSNSDAVLKSLLEKVSISSESPGLEAKKQQILSVYAKGILEGKKADFLDALLGYVFNARSPNLPGWEITYGAFTQKVSELTAIYRRETRVFPTKYLPSGTSPRPDAAPYGQKLFVQKLLDVEHSAAVSEAIADYLGASQTVLDEFVRYEIPHDHYLRYADEIRSIYRPRYRMACRSSKSKCNSDAQNFYDQLVSEPSPPLGEFASPQRSFRNGVLHMLADDANDEVVWKLK